MPIKLLLFVSRIPHALLCCDMLNEFRSGSGGDRIGLGANTGQADEDDDEFDQYRKRMMLSYRFRPNPMNNPRRQYY